MSEARETLVVSEPQKHAAARVMHEANRAYCQTLGDTSQVPWNEAPEWQRQSCLDAVDLFVESDEPWLLSSTALHDRWMSLKLREGWRYGESKDAEGKTHPCLLPFDELPVEQRFKDNLASTILHQFRDMWDAARPKTASEVEAATPDPA